MESNYAKSIIEALLFVADEPLPVSTLRGVLEELKEDEIRKHISDLALEYETTGRAYAITEIAEGFQIVTRPQFAQWIKLLFKSKLTHRLSKPALETLSIIAYRQPITKLEIESIRGVSVEGVLDTLLARDLAAIKGRKDVIGRPLLYGTTKEFLRYFGLKDLTEMPKIEELIGKMGEEPNV